MLFASIMQVSRKYFDENFMSISQRISQIIKEKGITQYQLCANTGLEESVLSRIINEETKKPRQKTVELIANYLHINPEWILTGEGSKHPEEESTDLTQELILSQQRTIENLSNAIRLQQDLISRLVKPDASQ